MAIARRPQHRPPKAKTLSAQALILLLLACGGGEGGRGPTDPGPPVARKTIVRLSVGDTCSALTTAITGDITATSFNFRTNTITIRYGQGPLDVELPRGGAYRLKFYTGNFFNPTHSWDQTYNIDEQTTTPLTFSCG